MLTGFAGTNNEKPCDHHLQHEVNLIDVDDQLTLDTDIIPSSLLNGKNSARKSVQNVRIACAASNNAVSSQYKTRSSSTYVDCKVSPVKTSRGVIFKAAFKKKPSPIKQKGKGDNLKSVPSASKLVKAKPLAGSGARLSDKQKLDKTGNTAISVGNGASAVDKRKPLKSVQTPLSARNGANQNPRSLANESKPVSTAIKQNSILCGKQKQASYDGTKPSTSKNVPIPQVMKRAAKRLPHAKGASSTPEKRPRYDKHGKHTKHKSNSDTGSSK